MAGIWFSGRSLFGSVDGNGLTAFASSSGRRS